MVNRIVSITNAVCYTTNPKVVELAGVQSSWGSAKKAVDLVTNGLFEKDNQIIDSIVSDLWSKL
jgi:hypothetical protein